MVGELWYQIVKYHDKQLIEKLASTTNLYVDIQHGTDSSNRSFTLKLTSASSEQISPEFMIEIFPEPPIPTLYRETQNNESDLFTTSFEKYGNETFFHFLIYSTQLRIL